MGRGSVGRGAGSAGRTAGSARAAAIVWRPAHSRQRAQTAARAASDSLQQAGETPDYLGDKLCNGGQHNTRHHATNRAWHRALSAVAIGPRCS